MIPKKWDEVNLLSAQNYLLYNNCVSNNFLRRLLLLACWPLTDLAVAAISSFFLITSGTAHALIMTVIVGTIVNIFFLRLLYLEKAWVKKRTEKIPFSKFQKISNTFGQTTAILLAYLISGPAMVGAPLIWLFGIPKNKGYILAFIGVCLNTALWVGGVYNIIWTVIRDIFHLA